jgi:hypothetical protein
MTDKEKLESLLPYTNGNLEEIVSHFLRIYISEFSPSRLRNFIKTLEVFLDTKISCYELAVGNAYEKACYLKSYLEGKMWKDEETARANVGMQIKNAESIINFHYIATGKRKDAE